MNFKTAIFSFLSGVLGSMGFGGGTVLIIYLTVFEAFAQTKAQGINLVFFIPCAIFSVVSYIRQGLIQKQKILQLIIPAVIGAVFGYAVIDKIPSEMLGKIFGCFLIIFAVIQILNLLFGKLKQKSKKNKKN